MNLQHEGAEHLRHIDLRNAAYMSAKDLSFQDFFRMRTNGLSKSNEDTAEDQLAQGNHGPLSAIVAEG